MLPFELKGTLTAFLSSTELNVIDQPLFYLLATLAVLIVGISKGGFGGGLAVAGVPLMSLVIPPFQAAAILLPILCLMDLAGLRAYWGKWHRPNLRIMVPGAIAGIVLASFTYRWISEDMLRLLIGGIAIVFSLNYYLSQWLAPKDARGISWFRGSFWSALSGFTSFAAHAGGPPVSIYLLPQRLDKTQLVGTTVVFFALVNYIKLIPYALLGQFDPGNLLTALVLMPVAIVGVQLGVWLHHHVDAVWFYRLSYAFLLITGGRLFLQGLGVTS